LPQLPTVGGDNGTWGQKLNDFLSVAHAADGTLANDVVTDAKVAASAAIAESKLALASDAAAGTASRRTLGTGAQQAAAGNHTHAATAISFTPTGTIAATNVQAAIAEVASEAGGGGGGGAVDINSLWIDRLPVSPAVRPNRTAYADFSNQNLVSAMFDLTQFVYDTDSADGNRPVIKQTASFPTVSLIVTKPGLMFRNFEVASRFRTTADMHPSTNIQNVGRYLSETNHIYARKNFSAGNPSLEVSVVTPTGNGNIGGAATTVDVTTTKIWKQKFRMVESVSSFKVWEDGTPEPDWQVQTMYGAGGGARWDLGMCGLRLMSVNDPGVMISELVVTELIPINDNMVFNPDFTLRGKGSGSVDGWSSGVLGWSLGTPPGGNSKVEWVDIPDASGVTRRFLHIARPTLSDPAVGGLVQVCITSKANALNHASGNTFLGIAVDCYYMDETTTESNVNHAGYYKVLGPNRLDSAGNQVGDGTDGTGTWGWRRDRVHLELGGTQAPNRIDFAVVVHDSDMIGEVWIGDFECRPVA
jgi:hypothetical protein